MAPLIDASWRRSGTPGELELASKRSKIIFSRDSDEIFGKAPPKSAEPSASAKAEELKSSGKPETSSKEEEPKSSSRQEDQPKPTSTTKDEPDPTSTINHDSEPKPTSTTEAHSSTVEVSPSSTDTPTSSTSKTEEEISSATPTSISTSQPTSSTSSAIPSSTSSSESSTSSSASSSSSLPTSTAQSTTTTESQSSSIASSSSTTSSDVGIPTPQAFLVSLGSASSSASLAAVTGQPGTQDGPQIVAAVVQSAQPSQTTVSKGGVAVAAVDSKPTPVVSTRTFQTVIPITKVDGNSKTTIVFSTLLSTSVVTATPGPVNETAQQLSDNSPPNNNTAVIAGGVVGGVLLLILIVGCAFFILRRNRQIREMSEATQPHPFMQKPSNSGSLPRDVESQRGDPSNRMVATRRVQASAAPSPRISDIPALAPTQNPFTDPVGGKDEYDQVPLSPADNGPEKIQIRPPPAVARNPFADPVVKPEPRGLPASVGPNRGVQKLRGGIGGLPARPSSAAKTPRGGNFGSLP